MANLEVDRIRLKSNYYNGETPGETPTVDNNVILNLDESELGIVYKVGSADNTQPTEAKIVSGPASAVSGGTTRPTTVADTCDELNNSNGIEFYRDSEATSKIGGFNVEKGGLSYSDSESTAKISSDQKTITNFNLEILRSLTIDTNTDNEPKSNIFVKGINDLPSGADDGTIYFVLGEVITNNDTNNQEETTQQLAAMKAKSTQTINKTKTTKKKTTKGGK